MKRLGLTLALLFSAFVTVGFASPPGARPIYVLNDSTLVSNTQLADALPAFQSYIDADLAPAWDVSGRLVLAADAPAGAWKITVTDAPACLACGGYHEWSEGRAIAEVGATLDRSWQVAFSHELAEMLADPYIHEDGSGGRMWFTGHKNWLVEIADPPEDEQFAYERDDVLLSDFVLPAWYIGEAGPYDFTGHCKRPFQVLEGGYAWYMTKGKWVER